MNDNWILCFCDFETTGVDPRKDQPIEVVEVDGLEVTVKRREIS